MRGTYGMEPGDDSFFIEWNGKKIGARGIVGLLVAFMLTVLGSFGLSFWLDRARADEHNALTTTVLSQVEEQRLTNYLLNLSLPQDRRLALPEPRWLREWVIEQQRLDRLRRQEEARRLRQGLP